MEDCGVDFNSLGSLLSATIVLVVALLEQRLVEFEEVSRRAANSLSLRRQGVFERTKVTR